jgi:uncharacterized protein involved in exopolysaccharide biosynthesis
MNELSANPTGGGGVAFSTGEQLFYHARLLRICLLLGLLLGLAGVLAARTSYTASSLLLVLIGPESAATPDASTGQIVISVDGLKIVQSEIQIIQTDQMIRAAIDQIGAATLYPGLAGPRLFGLRPPRDATALLGAAMQEFRANLRVDSEPGSNVIQIGFSHPDRLLAIRAAQVLLDAYLAQRRAIYASTNPSFLDQQVTQYSRRLTELDAQIQKLRAGYDVLDMAQDAVLATNRLDGIVQRQNQVRERQVAVQTEVLAVKANLATQPDTVLSFRETTNNTGNDEARNTLVRLQQDRTHMVSQYSATWPGLHELDEKIATLNGQISGKGQALYFSQRDIRNPAIDVLNNRLAALEIENQALAKQLLELDDQFHQADQRIKSLREADGTLHGLQLNRDVVEGIYRQLSGRLPEATFQASIVDQRNANLRVVQPPVAPIIGRSMAASYFVGAVLLGLMLGVAAMVLATLLRQVYLTPTEAERGLSLANLGEFEPRTQAAALADGPNGVAQLAALVHDTWVDGRPLATLQIIGVAEDDGKAALLRALASELAEGYGSRTLILDLQGDGDGEATLFGHGDGRPGAAELLAGVPIVATPLPALWVSVGAPQSVLGDKRASVANVQAALDALRQRFDIVLVIASDDLSGHVAHRLARMVDASMMVLRAEHTRAPVAARLRNIILSTGGDLLGFVFVGRKYYLPAWLYRWI